MHILVVNDDGPPGKAAPFVLPLVKALKAAGHDISVCLPDAQRSWIGKSHMITDRIELSYYDPDTHEVKDGADWVLVNSTPASATQIGLFHAFNDRPKIDLVVSGPNFGRNSTAIFALSSGTLGAAMEASVCGFKSIALSYAYKTTNHNWEIINSATDISVRLIEHLYKNWPEDKSVVDVYSINVPLEENIANAKVLYTNILQNQWLSGSCFHELTEKEKEDELKDAERREIEIRKQEGKASASDVQENTTAKVTSSNGKRTFKWAPKFADVYKTVDIKGEDSNDGWIVKEGNISVTPLKANFMHSTGMAGEIKLQDQSEANVSNLSSDTMYTLVDYSDDRNYVEQLLRQALQNLVPSLRLISNVSEIESNTSTAKLLTWSSYESIDFESLLSHQGTQLANSYIIRKALIRKHYLASTVRSFLSKNPESILKPAVPLTASFEVDYAEFLDEALVEEYELLESMEKNALASENGEQKEWWILKPGMSDRGMGIRLFSTMEELQAIFESFEEDEDDNDDEEEGDDEDDDGKGDGAKEKSSSSATGIVTSQLRHFVAQRYVDPPLLLQPKQPSNLGDEGRYKFHIRTYVLAVGALKIYVYKRMLALFAAKPYTSPESTVTTSTSIDDNGDDTSLTDLSAHLTNTCLHEGRVHAFWELTKHFDVSRDTLDEIYSQICDITSDLFRAAVSGGRVNFQPLPNAFELYGVDFVVDQDCGVKLLEVNAFPDFKQTGNELKTLIGSLFEGVVQLAVVPFFTDMENKEIEGKKVGVAAVEMFDNVLDLDIGRF